MKRGPRKGLALLVMMGVCLSLLGILTHDYLCDTGSQYAICERPDGTRWRDPSVGCFEEDPRCRDGSECVASRLVADPGSESCAWIFFKD